MQTHTTAGGSLVVTYESRVLPKLILTGGALFAATAVYDVTIGTRGTGRMIGLVAGIGLCLVAGLALLEESHFIFDPRTRTVRWRRRWAWSRTNGTLGFDAIRAVIAQTMGEGRTYPDRRICLQPVDGPLVPLTAGYAPDPKNELVHIADQIRAVVGARPPTSDDDTLKALVRDGHLMDAVRLLREQGMSLADAKRRVDELK